MRRAPSLIVALVLTLAGTLPQAGAHPVSPGASVVVGAPQIYTALVAGGGHAYFIIAYHLPDGQSTRVYADDSSLPLVSAPYDDVIVPADALNIAFDDTYCPCWYVDLDVELPNLGTVNLIHAAGGGLDTGGAGCNGRTNWYFQSSSRRLSDNGNVYGTIGGNRIGPGSLCLLWGFDAYGYFSSPRLTTDLPDIPTLPY